MSWSGTSHFFAHLQKETNSRSHVAIGTSHKRVLQNICKADEVSFFIKKHTSHVKYANLNKGRAKFCQNEKRLL